MGSTFTTEEFVQKAKEIHGDKYDYSLVDYKGWEGKVKIICPIHGIFEQAAGGHLQKAGCNKCNSSRGETRIRTLFTRNNVKFEEQKKYKDCKNIKVLPFDFFIPEQNILIEYNGKQHYTPVNIFGGEKQFKIQQIRDDIKRTFCKDNNIKLIEIKYDENIDTILKENKIIE